MLSPTERARLRFSLVLSPRAHPGAGDGLDSLDGLKTKSEGKQGTGGAAGPNNADRI
jgi:hypothetical protein